MPDTNAYIKSLLVANPLREPVMRAAIRSLRLPAGSRGLDAGCGIGLQALLLGEAVGASGHVTGLDLSREILAHAAELTREAGLERRVSFREGSIYELPFDDGAFDWVWSADCAGYGTQKPHALIRELARVLRPGGVLAILAWSSELLLPGYPALEARLDATSAGIAPFVDGTSPSSHFLRALGWFRETGLEDPAAETLAHGVSAPLSRQNRDALVALLEMRWPGAETELTDEDRVDFLRLTRPDSPEFVVDGPDYYAFFTYSLFRGRARGEDHGSGGH